MYNKEPSRKSRQPFRRQLPNDKTVSFQFLEQKDAFCEWMSEQRFSPTSMMDDIKAKIKEIKGGIIV